MWIFCCLYEADLDKQLDDVKSNELDEEESSDVNGDENDRNVNKDIEEENNEDGEKMDEPQNEEVCKHSLICLLYTSPSPRD